MAQRLLNPFQHCGVSIRILFTTICIVMVVGQWSFAFCTDFMNFETIFSRSKTPSSLVETCLMGFYLDLSKIG